MKRFFPLLLAALLAVSMFGITTASAASASVSFKGDSSVVAGGTYTYNIYVNLSGAYGAMGNIKCSGVFEYVSGDTSYEYWGSGNKNNSYKVGTIKVRVRSDAQPGDKGTISSSGGSAGYYNDSLDPVDISCSGSKTAKVVARTSSSSSGSTAAPSEWDLAADKVSAMQQGADLTLDITGSAKMPASVFAALKEKQGTLTINFGGYTCFIDGKCLGSLPAGVNFIDLAVSMEKDEALSSALGGADACQLHFAYEGELPGKITYTLKPQGLSPGETLYLYYFYALSGTPEGKLSATVNADGYVTIEIYHCSSYVLSRDIIEGASGVDFGAESNAAQALSDVQSENTLLQSRLDAAQSENDSLKSELEETRRQLQDASLAASDTQQPVPFSLAASVLAAAAALAASLLTMFICRAGIFKRKQRVPEEQD